MTVHQPSLEAYRLTDHLALIGRDSGSSDPGRLAYFGPSYPDAIRFFNPEGSTSARADSPDEVLRGLAKRPTQEWVDRFHRSKYFETFVRGRGAEKQSSGESIPRRSPRVSPLQQWLTLLRRGLVVKWKDRWNTGILLAQAPIVAILIVLVFGGEVRRPINDESWGDVARSLSMTIFMMGISSLWFGCSNAAREIVGEWAIYHRERMVNLRIGSYVASKLAILGGLCALQCLVLAGICSMGLPLRASWLQLFGVLWSAAMVGVGVGLLISSLARSSEVAIALLPIYLIPMVIVGGVMQPVHKMNPAIRACAAAAPSRWTFEAMLSLEAAQRPLGPSRLAGMVDKPGDQLRSDVAESNFPAASRNSVWVCATMLWGLAVLHLVGVVVVLRQRDVH